MVGSKKKPNTLQADGKWCLGLHSWWGDKSISTEHLHPESLFSCDLGSWIHSTCTVQELSKLKNKHKYWCYAKDTPRVPRRRNETYLEKRSLNPRNSGTHRLNFHWKWAHKPKPQDPCGNNSPWARVSRHSNQKELEIRIW